MPITCIELFFAIDCLSQYTEAFLQFLRELCSFQFFDVKFDPNFAW